MKERYQTVVLGATYYGLGFASSHPDCLILEESQTVGGDFHQCLHPVRMDHIACSNEMGKIMEEYGLRTAEGFDLLMAQAVVHEFVARKITGGMEILLDARLISVEGRDNGTLVTFVTNAGICQVWADRIVDATVNCISAPETVRCKQKSLNVFTVAMTEGFAQQLQAVCPECCVLDGPLENEKLIQFPFGADVPMDKAYRNMINAWKKAFPAGEEKILFVADNFDAVYEPVGECPAVWCGERFDDPIVAFEKGATAK